MELNPHQERVVKEKADLDERLNKLEAFIEGDAYDALPIDERHLLQSQAVYMRNYSIILGHRIAYFR